MAYRVHVKIYTFPSIAALSKQGLSAGVQILHQMIQVQEQRAVMVTRSDDTRIVLFKSHASWDCDIKISSRKSFDSERKHISHSRSINW